jgi:hypothetical protein
MGAMVRPQPRVRKYPFKWGTVNLTDRPDVVASCARHSGRAVDCRGLSDRSETILALAFGRFFKIISRSAQVMEFLCKFSQNGLEPIQTNPLQSVDAFLHSADELVENFEGRQLRRGRHGADYTSALDTRLSSSFGQTRVSKTSGRVAAGILA